MNISLEKACEIQEITIEDYQNAVKFVQEMEEEKMLKADNL